MRVAALVLGTTTLLLAAGCTLNTDYFGDYRGKNLLANYDFGAVGRWSLEPFEDYLPTGVSPVAGYDPADYMTWEPSTDLAAVPDIDSNLLDVGPDGSSPAYRLEIVNLLPDGDFEAQTDGTGFDAPASTWWTLGSGATADFAVAGPVVLNPDDTSFTPFAPVPNGHRSLFFSFTGGASGNNVGLQLDTALGASLWQRPGGYRFRFEFFNATNAGIFHVSMNNQGNSNPFNSEGVGVWDGSNLSTLNNASTYQVSRIFTLDGSPTGSEIYLGDRGGVSAEAAVVDNVRLLQNDLRPYVWAKLPSLNSGTLTLLPGSKSGAYVVSFYVHDDPTADQSSASGIGHVNNRLHSSGVTVELTAAVTSGPGTFKKFTQRPPGGWTRWTKVTVSLGFDFVDNDSLIGPNESALTVEFSPTNTEDSTTGGRDVGSLLIAQPVLMFNP